MMNVMVLGNQETHYSMDGLKEAANVEMVHVNEMPKALNSLDERKYDVVVVGGLSGLTASICRQVKRFTLAPVVLLVNKAMADWREIDGMEVAGYINEQVGAAEMAARLQAITRRSAPVMVKRQ
jgi:DNA-binding response OmpR family regulator